MSAGGVNERGARLPRAGRAPAGPPPAGRGRVLLAPDKFKGTFSAEQLCALLAPPFERLGFLVERLPVADGGEGTAAALASVRGGHRRSARVPDALGRPVTAEYFLLDEGSTAVLEVAAASGLWRIAAGARDALRASSRGTGELIAAAIAAGARTVLVAAGGSATTDGGSGALEALLPWRGTASLVVACDVSTPWERAAEVFAPQKGATPAEVLVLAERLEELALHAPRDPRGVPMTGCAGGLAGGLWAWCGAELRPGAELVLAEIGFQKRLPGAALAVTGEGRIDSQTLAGKAPAVVAARCRAAGVPCAAIVGSNGLDRREQAALGLVALLEASDRAALAAAPGALVEELAAAGILGGQAP
jgi:glycerate kinase